MNNKGKGSGLALVLILIAAILVAWLAVRNMGSLGFGGNSPQQQTTQENYVRQAQDLVDQLNQAQQQAGREP